MSSRGYGDWKGELETAISLVLSATWRESARSAVFRSRWTRSTRTVKTKEIEGVDEDGAAFAKLAKSRFLRVVSTRGAGRVPFHRTDPVCHAFIHLACHHIEFPHALLGCRSSQRLPSVYRLGDCGSES